MSANLFNETLLARFNAADFTTGKPFPWLNFESLLTTEVFLALHQDYPSLEKFERHQDMARVHNQRPHNRYYLAYESSIYEGLDRAGNEGVIRYEELAPSWQGFIDALETNDRYRGFISSLLGLSDFRARYAWHIGIRGSEVSPDRDAEAKIGTHIFYFNTSEDWSPEWGGSTLALSGKTTEALNPDFSQFESEAGGSIINNHSFLFKNTENAWHGVRPLTSPDGKYRRLFNVIFEEKKSVKRSFFAKLGL